MSLLSGYQQNGIPMLTWRDMILDRYEEPKSLLCIAGDGGYLFLLLIYTSRTLVFGMKYLHIDVINN